MNTSSRNILAGLTLVAAGIAVGWGVAQWRAGHLSGSPAANVCWRALKTVGCCRFQRHLVKVEDETGGGSWEREGNSAESSSLKQSSW